MENLVSMFKILQNCYKGKKVFVTGHTGFKGAWLLKILNLLGAEVKGYSLDTKTDIDLYNLINGNLLCDSVNLGLVCHIHNFSCFLLGQQFFKLLLVLLRLNSDEVLLVFHVKLGLFNLLLRRTLLVLHDVYITGNIVDKLLVLPSSLPFRATQLL